ncbi:heterokaryon incompatibility protein-domain-containing protein [Hyaloscypha sp. PMI_1271]|nr:heterokaryon incompatibility protein-domain-containing protein [Hyaloscypha sp. PMI_1271]
MLYQPIDRSSKRIRLLEILPSTDTTATIQCRLTTSSLHNGDDYIALSYVWGDASITKDIIINGERKPVTTNLASGLQHIWSAMSSSAGSSSEWNGLPNLFWVDAICINQRDSEERNHQVQLMGEIYTRASLVVSWLGPDDGTVATAFQTFRLISSVTDPGGSHFSNVEWMRQYPELWEESWIDSTWRNKTWDAVDKFLRRTYWNRVWIVQEMVIPTRLWMMAGVNILDYSYLVDAMVFGYSLQVGFARIPDFLSNRLWTLLTAGACLDWSTIFFIQQLRAELRNPDLQRVEKLDIVWQTIRRKATDPRDKIFGILGICNSALCPDYSKSVRHVYCEFGKKYVHHTLDLQLLNYASIGSSSGNQYDLPSWVPDFQSISTSGGYSVTSTLDASHNISQGSSLSRPFVDGQDHLHAFGCICDTVSTIQHHFAWGSEGLSQFCASYLDDGDLSPYTTGIPRLHALFRTLLQGTPTIDLPQDPALVDSYYRALYSIASIYASEESRFQLRDENKWKELWSAELSRLPVVQSTLVGDETFTHFMSWATRMGGVLIRNLNCYRIFETESGYLGLGPPEMLRDDVVCVLCQSSVPVILRRVDSHYIHVGSSFVLGLMEGEARERYLIESSTSDLQEFEIR